LAARQLKLALEKKLSKEYGNNSRPQDKNYDENKHDHSDPNLDVIDLNVISSIDLTSRVKISSQNLN
jgi:hypothetical protein